MNRLSDKEAIDLLKHGDILELGQQANKIRQEKHPGNTLSLHDALPIYFHCRPQYQLH